MNVTELWSQRDQISQNNQCGGTNLEASKIGVNQINQEFSINGNIWKPTQEIENLNVMLAGSTNSKKEDYNPFKAQYYNLY
jgi:hypothetical protein